MTVVAPTDEAYYSLIDPVRMKGWVGGLVGHWPAEKLPGVRQRVVTLVHGVSTNTKTVVVKVRCPVDTCDVHVEYLPTDRTDTDRDGETDAYRETKHWRLQTCAAQTKTISIYNNNNNNNNNNQLQVRCRPVKVRRSETDVLATQPSQVSQEG